MKRILSAGASEIKNPDPVYDFVDNQEISTDELYLEGSIDGSDEHDEDEEVGEDEDYIEDDREYDVERDILDHLGITRQTFPARMATLKRAIDNIKTHGGNITVPEGMTVKQIRVFMMNRLYPEYRPIKHSHFLAQTRSGKPRGRPPGSGNKVR